MADAIRALLGDRLLIKKYDDDGAPAIASTSLLEGKHVGLLFTRAFVPSCHRFLPQVQQQYTALSKQDKPFEIVYISQEPTQEAFDDYYAQQPWAALPFGSPHAAKLVNRFCKQGASLPILVMLDPTGRVLTNNAKSALLKDPASFPWEQEVIPTITSTLMSKLAPYSVFFLPLVMVLLMGYRLYLLEATGKLYDRYLQPLLDGAQPAVHAAQQAIQTYIDAARQAIQPFIDAGYKNLYRLYFGKDPHH